jgi:hypothetical protein
VDSAVARIRKFQHKKFVKAGFASAPRRATFGTTHFSLHLKGRRMMVE